MTIQPAVETVWIIQSNDGRRVWKTTFSWEAMFYSWLSSEFCEYNVYRQGSSGQPLMYPFDFLE